MLRKLAGKAATLARHPLPVVKTNLLLPLCVNIGRPSNYLRCSFICKQPWDSQFIRHYRRARHFRGQIDMEAVGVIRVLSYSRSGSHNFLSRLHYLSSCFVLRENLHPTRTNDPLWLSLTPDDIATTDYMAFSLFGLYGLQRKQGEDLEHLVAPFNKLLEHPLEQQEDPFPRSDRVLFLVRNFFRMLMSRQSVVEKKGKTKWTITDDVFYASINAHHRNVRAYVSLMESRPDRFHILGHEIFCARPASVFRETTQKLGVADGTWNDPGEFFVECLDGQTAPEVRGELLWDKTTEKPILGTGGNYNPRKEPSLERTLRDDVEKFVKKEWRDYTRKLFGKRLVELWLSDTPATYESMSTEEFTQLLCQAK